jgi:hypothetical protein
VPKDPGAGRDETGQPLPQHPLVGRLKPDASQPAQQVIELSGLPGDSDRAGHQRLYLTAKLDYYAEFLVEDIVYSEAVPADQSPVAGQEATKVGVRRDATVNYTWVRSPRPVDEFDLDVRLGGPGAAGVILPVPYISASYCGVCGPTRFGTCTCGTCEGCGTNNTQCGQATCANTCNTCNTQCGQGTCNTCNTQCGQATCQTCAGQQTCVGTCAGQHTCVATCGAPYGGHTCILTVCPAGVCTHTDDCYQRP